MWARPGTIVSWLAKEATVLRVTSQTSSLLLQGEEVLAVAVANTVLLYLPYYGAAVLDLGGKGKSVVMTNRRILLADVSLPTLKMRSPAAFTFNQVSVVRLEEPSRRYPFTEVAFGLPGGDGVGLRFTRQWDREAKAIATSVALQIPIA